MQPAEQSSINDHEPITENTIEVVSLEQLIPGLVVPVTQRLMHPFKISTERFPPDILQQANGKLAAVVNDGALTANTGFICDRGEYLLILVKPLKYQFISVVLAIDLEHNLGVFNLWDDVPGGSNRVMVYHTGNTFITKDPYPEFPGLSPNLELLGLVVGRYREPLQLFYN